MTHFEQAIIGVALGSAFITLLAVAAVLYRQRDYYLKQHRRGP